MGAEQTVFKVLIADRLGFIDKTGQGVESEAQAYIESQGAHFHDGSAKDAGELEPGVHFFYMPDLDGPGIEAEATPGTYDMVNLAATKVPEGASFPKGGVRWGAGTNNFPEKDWKAAGIPLMNVPAGNSVRTALTWLDALIATTVDLDIREVQEHILTDPTFKTVPGINLFPTEGLEGKRMAILGITGNIAHEVMNIANALRIEVVGYSRSFTKQDASDLGIIYAGSDAEAAKDADIVTLHFPLNDKTRGSINARVFNAAKHGFTLMNFSRGELVDPDSLKLALETGQVGKVAVDADITRTPEGKLKADAPLAPYLSLQRRHGDKMLLLPHIATDTDHGTRLGLARRGVDQTLALLRENTVYNSVQGGVPEGYKNGGTQKPAIGRVSSAEIVNAVTKSREDIGKLGELAAKIASGEFTSEQAVEFQRALNVVSQIETTGRLIRG